MAFMLSLPASSPLGDLHGNTKYVRPCSPDGRSSVSVGTVQRPRMRQISSGSLSSLASYLSPRLAGPDRDPSLRSISSLNLALPKLADAVDGRSALSGNSRGTSFASATSLQRREASVTETEGQHVGVVDLTARNDKEELARTNSDAAAPEDFDCTERTLSHSPVILPEAHHEDDVVPLEEPRVFRRWLSTLRRRKTKQSATVTTRNQRWTMDDFDRKTLASPPRLTRSHHVKSDSWTSSVGFVAGMRSATATLASTSLAPLSRRTSRWRRGQQRSSLPSSSEPRPSVDSRRSVMDEAANIRSRKRREKLEELIRTEESYVADVKALSNAYFTLLVNQPAAASFARASARQNIADILHLHDDLLGDLHRVVPFSEYDQNVAKVTEPTRRSQHARWHSVDIVPERTVPRTSILATIRQGRRSLNISRSTNEEPVALRCAPHIVADVAHVFCKHLPRFSVYEHYGANYDMVQRDIEETQRAITAWPDFDRAIEAISAHVNPVKTREANSKKALTVKDLLIKPIQRLPRYELLFVDLCKLTPVCDDPGTHALIEELLAQLNDTCSGLNRANDDTERTRMLEVTWTLGERLNFSNQVPRSIFLQLLGHVVLCGSLHIAYRSKEMVRGFYVICVLFDTTLLLANANEDALKYSVLAGISLANATIEESDNGKGLQCHTAPHSWKIVFEHAARMYETIFTACSATEAEIWRWHLDKRIAVQSQSAADGRTNPLELSSPLTAEMRSIGKAFGKPGSFVRRMSVHRTATVGPTTDLNQVIIKNTQAVKEVIGYMSTTSLPMSRSQSVATPSHVQTLAPRRADRVRLEAMLSDVWTKDLLPYPGMTVRRSDPIRASANSVMRKFSMASITSNFSSSKRSASYTSIANSRKEDMPPPRSKPGKPARLPLVDLLPADFELQSQSVKSTRSALRTLTLTMERPFSPLLNAENRASSLCRAKSTRKLHPQVSLPMPEAGGGVMETQNIPACGVLPERAGTPALVTERARTPAQLRPDADAALNRTAAKTPQKSKSKHKLLRLFGQ